MRFFLLVILVVSNSCNHTLPKPLSGDFPTELIELEALYDQSSEGNNQLEILWQLHKGYRDSDIKKSHYYLNELGSLATKYSHYEYIGKFNHSIGLSFKRKGDYGQSISYYLKAIENYEKARTFIPLANDLNNIGSIFHSVGDYSYSIQFFEKAKTYYLEHNKVFQLVVVNLNLGTALVKFPEPNYELAEKFLSEGLEWNKSNTKKQEYYYNRLYNQVGVLNYEQGHFNEAVKYYQKSLEYVRDTDEKYIVALINIGEALAANKLYQEAESILNEAIKISNGVEVSNANLMEAHNVLAKVKQGQNKHNEALKYLNKCVEIADHSMINKRLQNALDLILDSYNELKREGNSIGEDNLMSILNIKAKQDKLKESFDETVKQKGVQEVLRNQILIRELEKALETSVAAKKMKQNQAIFLGSLAVIFLVGITLILKIYRPFKANRVIREAHKWLDDKS